jgi:hypothetical protein
MKRKSKFLTFILSFFPGVGHMYLGYMKLGVQIMAIFLGSIFLTDWLRLSLLWVVVPIIWFYSMFDSLAKQSYENHNYDENLGIFDYFNKNNFLFRKRNKLLGWVLIIVGVYSTFERAIMPVLYKYFSYQVWETFKIGAISIILVIIGVKLLIGTKSEEKEF